MFKAPNKDLFTVIQNPNHQTLRDIAKSLRSLGIHAQTNLQRFVPRHDQDPGTPTYQDGTIRHIVITLKNDNDMHLYKMLGDLGEYVYYKISATKKENS